MTDIKKYIESGVIEEYYLGILSVDKAAELIRMSEQHPEVKDYMKQTAKSNSKFFSTIKKKPPLNSLHVIKTVIQDNKLWAETQLDNKTKLSPHFINISIHTPIEKVEAVIKELRPPNKYDNIFPTRLYADEQRELLVVWVKKGIPLEKHPKLDERFLILEGTVDCYINDTVFHMNKGDFMRIPPESKHQVIVTSKTPAKAILCRTAI